MFAVVRWHYSKCFSQMLVMGFPLARLEKLPKTSEWEGLGREHHSPVPAPVFFHGALRYLVGVLQERIFLLKQFFFIVAWALFCNNVIALRNPVGKFVLPR